MARSDRRRRALKLILIFSAVIKVKGKPSLSYIPLVTPSALISSFVRVERAAIPTLDIIFRAEVKPSAPSMTIQGFK